MSKIEVTKPGVFVVLCDEVASAWTFETREDAEFYMREKDELTGGNFGFHLYDLREIAGLRKALAEVRIEACEGLNGITDNAEFWSKDEVRRNAQALSVDVARIIDAALGAEQSAVPPQDPDPWKDAANLRAVCMDLAASLRAYVRDDFEMRGSTAKAAAHNARHLDALAALTAAEKGGAR